MNPPPTTLDIVVTSLSSSMKPYNCQSNEGINRFDSNRRPYHRSYIGCCCSDQPPTWVECPLPAHHSNPGGPSNNQSLDLQLHAGDELQHSLSVHLDSSSPQSGHRSTVSDKTLTSHLFTTAHFPLRGEFVFEVTAELSPKELHLRRLRQELISCASGKTRPSCPIV